MSYNHLEKFGPKSDTALKREQAERKIASDSIPSELTSLEGRGSTTA